MTNAAPGPAVAILGTGAMGSGIAQVAAQAGSPVHLVDAVPGAAARARDRLAATLDRLADKGRISREDADAATARLAVADSVADLPPCALVIEAIHEDLGAKRALFAELAQRQPAGTLLASNTSSLDISAIADGIASPDRVLGLHFFNPPPLMRLVEVVHGTQTSEEVAGARHGDRPRVGQDAGPVHLHPGLHRQPGGAAVLRRGPAPGRGRRRRPGHHRLRPARGSAGFRMGPCELTDLIGQDVNLAVGTSVWEQTGRDARYAPTDFQRRLVSEGRLGRKTGRGVFAYDDSGRPQGVAPDQELARRLVAGPVATNPVARTLAMLVNEAVDLVARGEASAEDVDTAMRLGTNYPRGPIEWGTEIGLDVVAQQLARARRGLPRRALPAQPGARVGPVGRGRPEHRSPRMSAAASGPDGASRRHAVAGGSGVLDGDRPDLAHVRRMWADDRASAGLGMELLELDTDRARVRMTVGDTMVNGHDIAHGGFLFTLADSAFALACNSRGRLTVAAGADVTFVAAARLGDVLVAEATQRTAYGRSGLTDVTVTRESDARRHRGVPRPVPVAGQQGDSR